MTDGRHITDGIREGHIPLLTSTCATEAASPLALSQDQMWHYLGAVLTGVKYPVPEAFQPISDEQEQQWCLNDLMKAAAGEESATLNYHAIIGTYDRPLTADKRNAPMPTAINRARRIGLFTVSNGSVYDQPLHPSRTIRLSELQALQTDKPVPGSMAMFFVGLATHQRQQDIAKAVSYI